MITIRKSVRPQVAAQIHEALQEAIQFLGKRYPEVNFRSCDFIFSNGYSRSRYFRNEKQDAKYKVPTVCICTRSTLLLYYKASLGMRKKKQSAFAGSYIQIVSALIHELTHHAQYELNRLKSSELETTRNELEYLKEFHPRLYNKFMEKQHRIPV